MDKKPKRYSVGSLYIDKTIMKHTFKIHDKVKPKKGLAERIVYPNKSLTIKMIDGIMGLMYFKESSSPLYYHEVKPIKPKAIPLKKVRRDLARRIKEEIISLENRIEDCTLDLANLSSYNREQLMETKSEYKHSWE